MSGHLFGKVKIIGIVSVAITLVLVAFQGARAQGPMDIGLSDTMLTYSRGQAVIPAYEG